MAENESDISTQEAGEEVSPKNSKKRIILFAVIGIVIALCAAYLALCLKGTSRSVDTQFVINGVNITGMSREDAEAAIQKKFSEDYADSAYDVIVDGRSCKVPVFSYLTMDASEGIDASLSYDGGPFIGRGLKYIQSLFKDVETVSFDIQPELSDTEGIYKDAETLAKSVYQEPVDPAWKEENDIVSITTGTPGKSVDAKEIGDEIIAGINKENYSGTVEKSADLIEPEELDLQKIIKSVYVAPKDATYSLVEGELVIADEESGKEILEEDLKSKIGNAKAGTTVSVKEKEVEADVTADELKALLLADLLSSYQVINGGSWTQITNQGLACEAINGTIVMPGDTFSFNDVVGDTTPDKGYVQDYAYENNKLVLQYGGGVCRIASTLYAAVLYTDLEVVMRYNHSSPVHYLPLGMDATVSYPLPDLQFRNNREYPIRIFMYLGDDGYVHAEIYGTHIEGEPTVDVQLDNKTSMLVDTYRNYYSAEDGTLIQSVYMHTSSYRELEPEVTATPTPTPTAAPTAAPTAEPTAAPTAEATETPVPEETATPVPEPEESTEPEAEEVTEETTEESADS